MTNNRYLFYKPYLQNIESVDALQAVIFATYKAGIKFGLSLEYINEIVSKLLDTFEVEYGYVPPVIILTNIPPPVIDPDHIEALQNLALGI